MTRYSILLSSILISCCVFPAFAGTDTTQTIKHHIGVNARASYIAPTHEFFKGENAIGQPLRESGSVHLQYGFSFPENSTSGRLYPTAYQGIGVGANTFFNKKEIGIPTALYVFQGAEIAKLAPKLSLDYEWNFGASFGWHKKDDVTNQYNTVVGSKINAYINVGFILSWHPTENWTVSGGLDMTHFSNGNTHYPNAGVNTIGGRIGTTYNLDGRPMKTNKMNVNYENGADTDGGKRFRDRMTYDVILYGAGRSKGLIWNNDVYIANGTFGIIGLNFSPLYRIHKCFRTGLSLDFQYDESANLSDHVAGTDYDGKIRFYRPPFREQAALGISARAELIMPIFSVNIGFGHNVLYKGSDLEGFYQILALKASVTPRLFLHVGYKLHKFHDPNNLMLGAGWRFGHAVQHSK